MYSDADDRGVMTAVTAQVMASGDISQTSPNFLLTPPLSSNSAAAGVFTWSAVAVGNDLPFQSQVALLAASTNFSCIEAAYR